MKNPSADYDLFEELIPCHLKQAHTNYLPDAAALPLILQKPGVIPIIISPERRLIWLDVGDYPFREWKFRKSVASALAGRSDVLAFTTELSILAHPALLPLPLPMAGFIFQMSFCGSTLFAKALARAAEHVVICEGTMLSEGLWSYLTDEWRSNQRLNPTPLQIIRRLIGLSCRARHACHQVGFVKFVSWNTIFIDQIRQAFPEVPCYFVYREPLEVLGTTRQRVPVSYGALRGTQMAEFLTNVPAALTATLSDTAFYGALYKAYFRAALKSHPEQLTFLNYRHLTAANFARILQMGFDYTPKPEAMAMMQHQFQFNAKDDDDATHFVSDCATKQGSATTEMQQAAEELAPLYWQLENSDQNLACRLA